ncbi:molecular chaperone DnaJ [Candidatus Nomurabacteria bacterium]|nr:molecular chaperone DnaJ [Candidatus Nomurabacteria bacterium]
MSKDYYKILGVNKSASAEEIKKAFRKLAHEHHPDKNNGDDAKFKEANEAYQVLSDKNKRAQYDQFGSAFSGAGGAQGNPFGGGNPFGQGFGGFGGAQQADFDFDLGDIFGSFFGGQGGGRSSRSQRGSDLEVNLEISLKDSVFGVTHNISLQRKNQCQPCQGTGAKGGTSFDKCATCDGAGRVTTTILGQFQTQTTCPECRGKGKSIKEKCGACSGSGFTVEHQDVKVEIPGGIDTGQSIRLSGQGDSGANGAPAGDLYVNIVVRPQSDFERHGFDLLSEVKIPFTIAALGGEIKVNTIDGQVKLKIPAGTQSNKKFILRNKGVTKLKSRGRGDQIVIVQVDVPTKLSRKQKKLLEELSEELGND